MVKPRRNVEKRMQGYLDSPLERIPAALKRAELEGRLTGLMHV